MLNPQNWARNWVNAWNGRDLDTLLTCYADTIELRSPFAKVYSRDGVVRGKPALREYWGEVLRRLPVLEITLVAVYSGHMAMTLHYRDNNGRNCLETILFNDQEQAIWETACFDRLR